MATCYTFDLDNGAQLHASEASTICVGGGATKTPAEVIVGDQVIYADTACATVTAINTAEV